MPVSNGFPDIRKTYWDIRQDQSDVKAKHQPEITSVRDGITFVWTQHGSTAGNDSESRNMQAIVDSENVKQAEYEKNNPLQAKKQTVIETVRADELKDKYDHNQLVIEALKETPAILAEASVVSSLTPLIISDAVPAADLSSMTEFLQVPNIPIFNDMQMTEAPSRGMALMSVLAFVAVGAAGFWLVTRR